MADGRTQLLAADVVRSTWSEQYEASPQMFYEEAEYLRVEGEETSTEADDDDDADDNEGGLRAHIVG